MGSLDIVLKRTSALLAAAVISATLLVGAFASAHTEVGGIAGGNGGNRPAVAYCNMCNGGNKPQVK
jgi:hypothetical protein